MIDLHCHSVFSDGTDSPAALAAEAARLGLTAIALTDHDTTASAAEMAEACAREGVEHVVGVEISLVDPLFPVTRSDGRTEARHVHVLGYFLSLEPEDPFQRLLVEIREDRVARNHRLVERLNELGFSRVTYEDLVTRARAEDSVGRPHAAAAMFDLHPEIVGPRTPENWSRLFEEWLGDGARAYVGRLSVDLEVAVERSRGSGVALSVAHPHLNYLPHAGAAEVATELPRMLSSLRERGLVGAEAHYGSATVDMRAALLRAARSARLVPTGGSDYHGAVREVRLGVGARGDLRVPDEVLSELREAVA